MLVQLHIQCYAVRPIDVATVFCVVPMYVFQLNVYKEKIRDMFGMPAFCVSSPRHPVTPEVDIHLLLLAPPLGLLFNLQNM